MCFLFAGYGVIHTIVIVPLTPPYVNKNKALNYSIMQLS